MKVISQPENYSDMLERVFVTTLSTGLGCTVALWASSPSFKRVVGVVPGEADLGPFKALNAGLVALPLLVAFISRMVKLHDRLSDVFRIRRRFDIQVILRRLAVGVGISESPALIKLLGRRRVPAMYATFYKYAGFKDPQIDAQLVRSALDSWGWFWSLIESAFLVTLTAVAFQAIGRIDLRNGCLIVLSVEAVFLVGYWLNCRRLAQAEVDGILEESARRTDIRAYFESLE